jgi:hypothetical protein
MLKNELTRANAVSIHVLELRFCFVVQETEHKNGVLSYSGPLNYYITEPPSEMVEISKTRNKCYICIF